MDPSRWALEISDPERQHDRTTTVFATALDSFGVRTGAEDDRIDQLVFTPLDIDVNKTCYFSATIESRFTPL